MAAKTIKGLLRKDECTGYEAGAFTVRYTIHEMLHITDDDYKPLATRDQRVELMERIKKREERVVFGSYLLLCDNILELHEEAIGYHHQFYHGVCRYLTFTIKAGDDITATCVDTLESTTAEDEVIYAVNGLMKPGISYIYAANETINMLAQIYEVPELRELYTNTEQYEQCIDKINAITVSMVNRSALLIDTAELKPAAEKIQEKTAILKLGFKSGTFINDSRQACAIARELTRYK